MPCAGAPLAAAAARKRRARSGRGLPPRADLGRIVRWTSRKLYCHEISIRYLMKRVPMTAATELKISNVRGFYIRKVTPFGTSAKVDCPKEHLGKTVYLVVVSD